MYTQLPYVYPQTQSRSPTRNVTGLTAGQWQGAISQCSAKTGLNAAQCAQTLSRSRSPTPMNTRTRSPTRTNTYSLSNTRSQSPTNTRTRSPTRTNTYSLSNTYSGSQSPRTTQSLNTEELRKVAQALGINTTGDAQYLTEAIRNRVGTISPRTYRGF